MPELRETLVATAASLRQCDEWSLALMAEGIQPRIVRERVGWSIWVAEAEGPRAESVLVAYESENRSRRNAELLSVWEGDAPLVVALLLVAASLLFYLVTGAAAAGSIWFERGAATKEIVSSEPWRAVTSLTLHADQGHALANAVAGALFFTLWLRVFGPGIGAILLLAAGALGNALNAGLQLSSHLSVGASTAVFGAVGLLAGVAAVRRPDETSLRHRPWMAAGAGLSLLALLGTGGVRTDVWAHLFGLLAGAGFGAAGAAFLHRPPPLAAQWGGGVIFVTGVLGAWRLALG